MNNIEDMKYIINSINSIMENKIEDIDEGLIDDLKASAKHGMKRVATKTKAALGSKKSAGQDKRDSLAKKMLDGWYNWIGLTGKEGTSEDLEKFLYTKVGFSRDEAQQLMAAVGKNILGNDRDPDDQPNNNPDDNDDGDDGNDNTQPPNNSTDNTENTPSGNTNTNTDAGTNASQSGSIKNKDLNKLVTSLETLQNKNYHGGNINLMNFKKMSGDIINILKKLADPDVSKEDKLIGANSAMSGIDFISSNDRNSVTDSYALSTYRSRLEKFINKLNSNQQSPGNTANTNTANTNTANTNTANTTSNKTENKPKNKTANDNSNVANDDTPSPRTANDNRADESITEDIIGDGEVIPKADLIKFFTDAAGYAYEHNLVGKQRRKDDYGVPHNVGNNMSSQNLSRDRGAGQNYRPYTSQEKQEKQNLDQIEKTWRNAEKLGLDTDDIQNIKNAAKKKNFEGLSGDTIQELAAIGWSFLRTLR